LFPAALAVQNDKGGDNCNGDQNPSDGGQPKTQEADALTMPLTSGVELGEILEVRQCWMSKLQFLEVVHYGRHLGEFAGLQEGNWIPFPLVVNDLAVQADRVVGSDQVTAERALTSWRNDQLLRSRIHMQLRMSFVAALQMDWSGLREVDNKPSLLELIDVLLHGDHLECAQVLGLLKLLHVKSPETGVIENL
jgi:hypothetical protein